MKIEPTDRFINWQQGSRSNRQARAEYQDLGDRLRVEVALVTDMTLINAFDFFQEQRAEHYLFDYSKPL